jgi:hypothetical protein
MRYAIVLAPVLCGSAAHAQSGLWDHDQIASRQIPSAPLLIDEDDSGKSVPGPR